MQRVRASAVCEAEGKLLLVRLRDPATGVEALYPPGGKVELDERPADAARRETLEETGARVRINEALSLTESYPFVWAGEAYDVTTHFFIGEPEEPLAALRPVKDADFNLGASWVETIEALDALAVHPAIASPVGRLLRSVHVSAWQRHTHFGGPASTLLAIHDQFRRATDHLETLSEPDRIARAFRPLATVLHHHHHAEELMLFPFVERHRKRPAKLFDDHKTLTTAISALEQSPSKDATTHFARVLRDHLVREELEVIPLLLAMSPRDAWTMLEG